MQTEQAIQRLDIQQDDCFATSTSLYADSARMRPYLVYAIESKAARVLIIDEGEGSTPEAWWSKRVLTVALPGFATGAALCTWLADQDLAGLLAALDRGTGIERAGGNFVGRLTSEAQQALETLEAQAQEAIENGADVCLIEVDAVPAGELFSEWVAGDEPVTAADVRDALGGAVDKTHVLDPAIDYTSLAKAMNEELAG